jgi:restriction system protein
MAVRDYVNARRQRMIKRSFQQVGSGGMYRSVAGESFSRNATDAVGIGRAWDGRLEEWLSAMAGHDPDKNVRSTFQNWSFPTDELLEAYVATLDERPEEQVRHLLRCFLFDRSTFGSDKQRLDQLIHDEDEHRARELLSTEYGRRLVLPRRGERAHPGVRWTLDLLPDSPRHALAVIDAYVAAFFPYLPDGRLAGLWDASTLISARYLHRRDLDGRAALQAISAGELEQLVARLYTMMGYDCELTPPSRDGGRDVIAVRDDAGKRERRLIDCKHYSGSLHIKDARALLGIVSTEHATVGVLLTTGRATQGIRQLRDADSRLDLVEGDRLLELLDEYLGPRWPERLDYWLRWPPRD